MNFEFFKVYEFHRISKMHSEFYSEIQYFIF